MPDIVLAAQNLTKRFGSLVAVNDLSVSISRGEVFGLLGPNGAGKTTSINLLCGLSRPDAGTVEVNGIAIQSVSTTAHSRIGMCPQEIIIWPQLTCREQLKFVGQMYGLPGEEAVNRGDMLLTRLGLAEKRNKLAKTLSGGMKRRLNLALALVHNPEIVVLDEPEAGLDPQSRVLVREYIHELAGEHTIILTTHNMDEADRICDRVAIIDHGELLVCDTPDALKHSLGEGDVLEINLEDDHCDGRDAVTALGELGIRLKASQADGTLLMRGLDIVSLMPEILRTLTGAGYRCSDVRLRQNTLEDVFIQLTGRRLRE